MNKMTNDKSNKYDIIIAQTHLNNLNEIKKALENPLFEIFYTSNPFEALLCSPDSKILISGQFFYRITDQYSVLRMTEFEKVISQSKKEYMDLYDGTNLVKLSRKLNPELITIRYSLTPMENDYFCGDINKIYLNPIKELLTNKNLIDIINSKNKKNLPKIEGVEWYLNNFPKSWR